MLTSSIASIYATIVSISRVANSPIQIGTNHAKQLSNEVTKNLPKYVIPAVIKSGLSKTAAIQLLEAIATGNTTLIESVPGITPSIIAVATTASKFAYQKSFEIVYFVSIAFGVVAITTAMVVSNKKLNEAMTPEIARKLQGVGKPRKNDEEKM
jgi:hypothetical protein